MLEATKAYVRSSKSNLVGASINLARVMQNKLL